jgi:DeoR/GlpR family transcriptional regulator of sugar metabolism
LSAKEGITEHDWEVAQVKKALIRSAGKTAVLSISDKLESSQKLVVSPLRGIDCLITELAPNDKRLAKYAKLTKVL